MGLLKEAIRIHELRLERFPNDPTAATVRAKIEQLKSRIKA
jgi:molecular chaperone DnaK (HSP70)